MTADEVLEILKRRKENREHTSIYLAINMLVEAIDDINERLKKLEGEENER